ncbi:MAG: glycosyltransferase [Flavobacterium sp.]
MKQKPNKILIVCGFFPLPMKFGGAIDVLKRIELINTLPNYEIDIICTIKSVPPQSEIDLLSKLVKNIFLVKRNNYLTSLFRSEPLQVCSRNKIKMLKLDKTYDLTILESEFVGPILENKTLKSKKVALRIHNNEEIYFKGLAKSSNSIFKKAYYFLDAIKLKIYSPKIFNKVDRLWFISSAEYQSNVSNFKNSIHLPTPVNLKFKVNTNNSKTVIYVCSLFMPNNIDGLVWYLNEVHKKLLSIEGYQLIVVGNLGDKKVSDFDFLIKKNKRVSLHTNVDDLDIFYQKSKIFINPMRMGSGVKLKSINAIENGLLLVSTTVGIEGIGLVPSEMFFLADDADNFYQKMFEALHLSIDLKKTITENAQKFLIQKHDSSILINELENVFNQ